MPKFKCSLFLLIPIFFSLTDAQAYTPKEGNINATLGPFFYKTYFKDRANGIRSPFLGDVALIVNGDVSDRGALEIALFHMRKIYFREQASQILAQETELLHITMGYRRWLNSWSSLSMAFFSAYSMGEVHTVHDDFLPGTSIDTSAKDVTEYGVDFSAQVELLTKDRYTVLLDGRYSLSATAKPNEKADHWGIMLGLRYFIQAKQILPGRDLRQ